MEMKAAVLYEFRQPLVVEQVELLPPKAGEVLVKYAASGVCHSDWTRMQGHRPIHLPIVNGHETSHGAQRRAAPWQAGARPDRLQVGR